jgi:uncharacterized protein (TIGR03435 family)
MAFAYLIKIIRNKIKYVVFAPSGRINREDSTEANMRQQIIAVINLIHVQCKSSIFKKLSSNKLQVVIMIFMITDILMNSLSGQTQSQARPRATFEAASIKISNGCGNTSPSVGLSIPVGPSYQAGGRYFACASLKWIITDAYQLEPFLKAKGGPSWMDDTVFQILAKAEGNPDEQQMRLMARTLLEDRFKLRMHLEKKGIPVYWLVAAKGGNKLHIAKDDKGRPIESLSNQESGQKKEMDKLAVKRSYSSLSQEISMMPLGSSQIMGRAGGFLIVGRATKLGNFAATLSQVAQRKIIDKTGLNGLYDIQLEFALGALNAINSASSEPSAPNIFRAIQEQLGLKLEDKVESLDQFIIDNLEKPSEN